MNSINRFIRSLFLMLCYGVAACNTLSAYADRQDTSNKLPSSATIINGEWMPYISRHLPDGGILTQIVTESFQHQNIQLNYLYRPWKESMDKAIKGESLGTIGWIYSHERAKNFWFSEPISSNDLVILHLKTHNYHWKTLEDLQGLRIGAIKGYYYTEAFEKAEKAGQFSVQRFTSEQQMLRKLFKGEIDIMISEKVVINHIMQRFLTLNEQEAIKKHANILQAQNLYFLVSKKYPNAKQFLTRFNQGLAHLKNTGRYSELHKNFQRSTSAVH